MGKKQKWLLLILALLLLSSIFYVVGGAQAYTRYQQSMLIKQVSCGGQAPVHICVRAPASIFSAFYPSDLATQQPLFAVDYSSSRPLTLAVTVILHNFSQRQQEIVNADMHNQMHTFSPPLIDNLLPKFVNDVTTLLHVEVTDMQGHKYYISDTPIVLYSRFLMQWNKANRLKIGAWVMPNSPAIVELVARGGTHLHEQEPPIPTGFVGYTNTSSQQVINQVNALYDAVRMDYHVHYIQQNVPYDTFDAHGLLPGSGKHTTQLIKLPVEILQQRNGSGIELTVLLASAVESVGLHPEIVIVPGRVLLGVAVTGDDTKFEYWDTTGFNNDSAADSVNVQADNLYASDLLQHAIVDTILISDARKAHISPMV